MQNHIWCWLNFTYSLKERSGTELVISSPGFWNMSRLQMSAYSLMLLTSLMAGWPPHREIEFTYFSSYMPTPVLHIQIEAQPENWFCWIKTYLGDLVTFRALVVFTPVLNKIKYSHVCVYVYTWKRERHTHTRVHGFSLWISPCDVHVTWARHVALSFPQRGFLLPQKYFMLPSISVASASWILFFDMNKFHGEIVDHSILFRVFRGIR